MKKLLKQRRHRPPTFKFDLKMKLTTLLLITMVFGMQANDSYSQKTRISLDVENITIDQVLDQIESTTEFKFIYNIKNVDLKRKVSIKVDQIRIQNILRSLFDNTQTSYKIRGKQVILNKVTPSILKKETEKTIISLQQTIKVTGQVLDDLDAPLPGVSVVEKGTINGVASDFDGNFEITVESGATLVFTSIGYKEKEVLASTDFMNITLNENTSELEEVVVTGYATKEKRKLTSAIATIDKKQIENVPMATFDQILQGSAPGLTILSGSGQPGDAASVNIRGLSSLSLSNSPLFILDGQAIRREDFAGINPNDIESVSVLKDAAATQIYGSRGSNGVIVITTKSGKLGKATLEYRTYTGVSIAPKYNDALQPLSSSQLINLSQEIGIGGVVNVGSTPAEIEELKAYSEDWLGVLTRNGRTNSHELNMSGGNENTKFFISGSYFSQEGIALRSRLDRYSLRTKIDYSKNRFTLGANIFLSYTSAEDSESEGSFGRSNPFYASIRTPAYDRAIDPDTGGFADPLDASQSSTRNNLERVSTNDEDRKTKTVLVSLNGRYDFNFLKGLSFNTSFNVRNNQNNNRTYVNPNSVDGLRRQGGQGSLSLFTRDRTSFTITNSLQYKFNINEDHKFNTALYQEFVSNNDDEYGLSVFGLNQLRVIDGATQGSDTNGFIPEFDGANSVSNLSSYFATLDYSYLNKYNITAGVRRDGSSNFGANFAFGNFYSVGMGWLISEENLLSSIEDINLLKLRASFGTVGNQNISSTAARPIFTSTSYNGIAGISSGLSNPDLKWEETAKTNIGLDVALFNNRLTINADVYSEKTTDLFQDVPLSGTTGFDSQLRNIGSLKNEGVELAISSVNIDTEKFRWTSSFNVATNETTILKLNNGESFIDNDDDDNFLIEEGGSYPEFYLVKRAGVNPANGRTLWYDLDGNLTETYDLNNRVNVGRATPKYTGGFLNVFTSGGFEFSTLFSFSQGKKIFNVARTSLDNPTKISRGSVSTNALRFWRQSGDITDIPDPRQISNYFFDSGWLEDASFIKLRNVRLSYNLPNSVLEKINLSGMRFYLQGQNVFTWTSFSGLDPENSSTEYIADYPALSTYTFGIDVKF